MYKIYKLKVDLYKKNNDETIKERSIYNFNTQNMNFIGARVLNILKNQEFLHDFLSSFLKFFHNLKLDVSNYNK